MATMLPSATPVMPSLGAGPRPRVSMPPTTICTTDAAMMTAEGSFMLPVPRTTEASVLHSQTSTAPANRMWP